MRARSLVALISAFLLAISSVTGAEVAVGDSYESVVETLGKPESEMNAGKTRVLNYGDSRLRLVDGVVVKIDRLKHYTVDDSRRQQQVKAKAGQQRAAPRRAIEIRRDGAQENIANLIVPGKVTVLDFFADWCGPCKAISPKLVSLTKSNPDVYLRKIDIVNWNTPIVKQVGIRSIPKVFVFDRSGKQMGPGTSSYSRVAAWVEQASRG